MFPNLKGEMAKKGINLSALSELTNIPLQRLSAKLSGKRKLTFEEAVLIKTKLELDMPLDEIFERKEA